MKNEMMFSSFDGTKLYTVKDSVENKKAVIVIVHGLCEHLGRYDYLTEKLKNSHYSVYRFDHRGHGKSEGATAHYHDFTELINDIDGIVEMIKEENKETKIFLIGHSMGGYGVALYGTKHPGKVDGIVVSGGLTRYNTQLFGPIPMDLPSDHYLKNALGAGVCSDPAVIKAYVNDPLVKKEFSVGLVNSLDAGIRYLKENPKIFTEPIFLLHGANDGLVNEKDSRDFFADIKSEDKSLKIYSKLMHEIFNEFEKDEVIAEAIAWIDKRV